MDARASSGPRHGGVDWSWDRHAVCILEETGEVVDRFDVAHGRRGLEQMNSRLRSQGAQRVAIERPDGPVVDALLAAGLQVVVISPRQVRAYRLRHGTAGNKDDRFDALVLADALRTDGHRMASLEPDTPATRALRALVRARKDLVGHRIAVHNQLLANLQQAFPGAVGLFAQLDSAISLTFLRRFPTAERARWLSERRLASWLRSVGYAGRRSASELMAHLDAAPEGLLGEAGEAFGIVTTELVGLLGQIRERIEALDRRIAEALGLHPDGEIFRSLPRAGVNRAALLLAEIGDCRGRYPDESSLAAAAGGGAVDASLGEASGGELSPGLRQAAAGSAHRLRTRQRAGKPVGPRHLRPSSVPGLSTPPCRQDPRSCLGPGDLALLDRRGALRPRSPRGGDPPGRLTA